MNETSSSATAPTTTTAPAARPFDPVPVLAEELNLATPGVSAVVKLLAEGATVPFIARYRKEATGGLDEVAIRTIEERRTYLLELEERRGSVLSEIEKQGKLTEALSKKILACRTKAELEDLYLPFKPKRRTRAIFRTSALSAMRSAQISRAPASAAAVSGTSVSALTKPLASASGLPSSGCPHMRSARGPSPRSRAMMARVRRLGLNGR
jgi:hypothetical protein